MSPELQLTAELCRRAFVHGGGNKAPTVPRGLNWARLLRLARFHRVQGLVSQALPSLDDAPPVAIAQALSDDALAITANNLRAAVESRDLLAEFEAAGIPLLFVKGLTLGALAYSRPLLKMSWDIDLLVAPDDVGAAGRLLQHRGYRLVLPEEIGRLERWHRRRKESVWTHDSGIFVELHTRLADNPSLIPTIGVGSPRRSVEVAQGIRLPTLEDDELFAHLCVHGASSAWFRLKWITDFAGLLAGRSAGELERLYERSLQLGAGRASAQALLVADHFYGTIAGTRLKPRLERDRASRWLARAAVRQLAGRAEPSEPTEARLGTAPIHWTQLLLLPGFGFKAGELTRQLSDALGG
jgi:hypothetical protein